MSNDDGELMGLPIPRKSEEEVFLLPNKGHDAETTTTTADLPSHRHRLRAKARSPTGINRELASTQHGAYPSISEQDQARSW